MKRKQQIALLLVVIMAVSAVPAIAAAEQHATPAQTPSVGQYRTPTLTIGHEPANPLRGQNYIVTGRLSYGGAGLANRPLTVWVMWPRPGVWQWVNAATLGIPGLGSPETTDSLGRYAFGPTSSRWSEVWWKVRFNGDSVYYAKNVYAQIYIGKTTTTIEDSSTHNPHVLSGRVRNVNGIGIQGIPVKLYSRSVGSTTWHVSASTYVTINTGGWKTADLLFLGTAEVMAVSQGSNIYSPSQSRIIRVTP